MGFPNRQYSICYGFEIASTLTLLDGHQEEHPACKHMSDVMLAWLSVWSKVHIICAWFS